MPDFIREFGANAAFVEELYGRWRVDARSVSEEWAEYFSSVATAAGAASPSGGAGRSPASPPPGLEQATSESLDPPTRRPAKPKDAGRRLEPLRGVAGKIVRNMTESLAIPTATSVRSMGVKLLDENRTLLNRHLAVLGRPKASFTHLVAWAIVRALRDLPHLNTAYAEAEGEPQKILHGAINLGIAIDLEGKGGTRTLVVPNVKDAGSLGFSEFLDRYNDVVDRARKGKLAADDFAGTTVTLTNPGTLGTVASVPRLMPGQGLILATGAISYPAEYSSCSPDVMVALAISKVMTMTSTYDHRVIQGAESGALLARIDAFLQAEDGFYVDAFDSVQCPVRPFGPARDRNPRLLIAGAQPAEAIEKQARVLQLINAYRVRGARIADLDPLEYRPVHHPELELETYGLTVWDLDRSFITGGLGTQPMATLREILEVLLDTYCRRIGPETMHLSDPEQKRWLQKRMEPTRNLEQFLPAEQQRILQKLNAAEAFERFLHTRYVGHKRFSLEGAETLIPMLDELLTRALDRGVERVVIGMAHRGRLNVLVNTFNKPYEKVFSEFEGLVDPSSYQGSGDVKYHLGAVGEHIANDGRRLPIMLASNPSHLEAVNPVVEGIARALQHARGEGGENAILPVLIHGDAAFAGQGVVAETLNMSQLAGYRTGGTIHIVVNNQIGYTAGPKDTRSTHFCTDMAKSVGAPILHVNGDYPESVLRAIRVAFDFREKFHHDVVVDMVCYRRWGHNETDEPAYTQPLLYRKIQGHPSVRERYGRLLVQRAQMTEEQRERSVQDYEEELKRALEAVRAVAAPPEPRMPATEVEDPRDFLDAPNPETGVPLERLTTIVTVATTPPDTHHVHPNLARQLVRRVEMVKGEAPIDWGCAEALAFGSLLLDGIPIRLAGQDSGRGTFGQRHSVLRDQANGSDWIPLNHLPGQGARFEVIDSLLSEEAALAYEYGFATATPHVLVLWEAQFGDFCNGAQIAIDQFIAASEAKWNLRSGVVLLLPHGYDGQGPEHSSARIERFLQLAAEGNMTIANCSNSGQYFHLLRHQGRKSPHDKRPLVVFTPKSLLKKKEAGVRAAALVEGRFEAVLDDARVADAAGVTRVLFCSGKVFYDLDEYRAQRKLADTAIVRLEQLYPFPRAALRAMLARYPSARRHAFVQEEPKNMGSYAYAAPRFAELGVGLVYVGRRAAASPATGSLRSHQLEQQDLVRRAFES